MKLKFELVNGYGVLVDEDAEIKDGDWFFLDMTDNNLPNELHQMGSNKKSKTGGINFYHNTAWTNCCSKIIFAEPELKLEGVPAFKWRDFEVEKLAEEEIPYSSSTTLLVQRMRFIQGYKSNPAKYTEEDLRKALWELGDVLFNNNQNGIKEGEPELYFDTIIQSLTKKELWIEVEEKHFRTVKNKEGQLIDNQFTVEPKITEGKIKAVWK